ncbi:MAG: arginine--tRNA ligase [Lachnospiraceae bacterium]|nr:arginine--tRNA ligase [Lachnospiraceae bacterium]
MKKILDLIGNEMAQAFEAAGYDAALGKVTWSNRPDLCEVQCNGAMAGAKLYKKAPAMIANDVADKLSACTAVKDVEVINPGFINMNISDDFLIDYVSKMSTSEKFGLEATGSKKMIIDYGGPNVAKPLHVGHLRSAVIGQCIKNLCRYMGDDVTGDIHLGDWGLQMGLIMTELRKRHPDLVYFDSDYTGDYPDEPPFTLSDLEEIYPAASAKSKEDEAYKEEAMNDTFMLQQGDKGRTALWKHIMNVSIPDLKKNYDKLNVSFELWKGESDAKPYIKDMVQMMKDKGFAYESEGALVVDVKKDDDAKEIPPCMILKKDGAALYTTTDLATILDRMSTSAYDKILYITDKRQEMHFTQVFRCAQKTGIVKDDTELAFLGFGTMNGKDGKPFKTREGGVMRLESLLKEINDEMYKKITDNREVDENEARKTADIVALAAVKYGDLSNQPTKDYIFDIDKFTSFEGNTGPYILYTIVRIKSILAKYEANGKSAEDAKISLIDSKHQKNLMMDITKFAASIEAAYEDLAPYKICSYIYDLANSFNGFYHECRILAEEDADKQESYIALLVTCKRILEECIEILGFGAPERM